MTSRYRIEPSVLARTKPRFISLQAAAVSLSASPHVDIMDGVFVPTRSIGQGVLRGVKLPSTATVHLMVTSPTTWLESVARSGAKRVILHLESTDDIRIAMAAYRSLHFDVGVGIRLDTPLRRLRRLSRLPWVHVMCGPTGSYGSAFSHQSVNRIRTLRRLNPRSVISCDVGMNQLTIPVVTQAGASIVVVGSYIWRSPDPRLRWVELEAQRRAV